MNLRFPDFNFDLPYTMIMGVEDFSIKTPFDAAEVRSHAEAFVQCGANFLEFGFTDEASVDQQIDYFTKAIDCVKDLKLILAVYTSSPVVMQQAIAAGAHMIIDPMALREEGALEMAAQLNVPVCLCFDQSHIFNEETDLDPCALVSDFFYERIDSCMNAGIDRSQLLLDPMLGIQTSNEYRLKMLGRLKTLHSFGLALTCEVPRALPAADEYLEKNLSSAVAVALFMQKQGIHILRTKHVYDITLALDTWQALNSSARPFKLSIAVKNKLKSLAAQKKVEK